MTDFENTDYFTDPALVDDPFPFFEHLRAQCPVTHLAHHGVIGITGYDEASEVWRDHTTFSSCNAVTGPFPGLPVRPEGDDANAVIDEHRDVFPMAEYLITQDPPAHDDSRGILNRLLTPRRLQDSEPYVTTLADQLIDGLLERGTFEVQHDFGHPFAMLVITELLGLPEVDRREFAAQLGVEHPEPGVGGSQKMSKDPLRFLLDTFAAYIEARRREPLDDVLTQLAAATGSDGRPVDVAIVSRTAAFIFAAGQDTTARLIAASLRIIAENGEIQRRLRQEPGLVADFIEEVLRMDGPVKTVSRMARVTTSVGGVAIPAGTTLAIFPHATNRDPSRFDDPNEFRIGRPNVREHLAFGRGIHACPGGALARIEARIAIERLLARTSSIGVSEVHHGPADARRFEYVPTYILRGINALHLVASPAT